MNDHFCMLTISALKISHHFAIIASLNSLTIIFNFTANNLSFIMHLFAFRLVFQLHLLQFTMILGNIYFVSSSFCFFFSFSSSRFPISRFINFSIM